MPPCSRASPSPACKRQLSLVHHLPPSLMFIFHPRSPPPPPPASPGPPRQRPSRPHLPHALDITACARPQAARRHCRHAAAKHLSHVPCQPQNRLISPHPPSPPGLPSYRKSGACTRKHMYYLQVLVPVGCHHRHLVPLPLLYLLANDYTVKKRRNREQPVLKRYWPS